MKPRIARYSNGVVVGLAAAVGLLLVPAVTLAGDFDGSHGLLCATTTLLECQPTGECARSTHAQMDLPTFVEIDFKHKRLMGRPGGEKGRTSAIEAIRKQNGRTILQGGENGRGWSVDIDQATGTYSAAIAGDRVGFVLFGACTVR